MTACPKTKNYRDANLLRMARGRLPLLQIPGVYSHITETTVACHSNWLEHGKGKSIKAHDFFTVWGSSEANYWLDQGHTATKSERKAAFDKAHRKQLQEWEKIAEDAWEPEKFRESARNAIAAFSEWVTENAWRFCEGDWQLEYSGVMV